MMLNNILTANYINTRQFCNKSSENISTPNVIGKYKFFNGLSHYRIFIYSPCWWNRARNFMAWRKHKVLLGLGLVLLLTYLQTFLIFFIFMECFFLFAFCIRYIRHKNCHLNNMHFYLFQKLFLFFSKNTNINTIILLTLFGYLVEDIFSLKIYNISTVVRVPFERQILDNDIF